MPKTIDPNPRFPNAASPNFAGLKDDLIGSALGPMQIFRPIGKYMTGARAIIKVNNKLAGFAFNISWNVNTTYQEIFELDSYVPYELAPTLITVTGTIGMFHIPGKGPVAEGFQPNVLSFLHHKYITIQVVDSSTGNIMLNIERAVITNKSQALNAGDVSQIQLSWKAIGWSDDQPPTDVSDIDEPAPDPVGGAAGALLDAAGKVGDLLGF